MSVFAAAILLGIIPNNSYSAPPTPASPANKNKKERFLAEGWHPYIGANYAWQHGRMQFSNYYKVGEYDSPKYLPSETSERGSLNGLSFFAGVGRMYRDNFYFGIEAEAYVNKKLVMDTVVTKTIIPEHENGFGIGGQLGLFSVRPLFDFGVRVGYAINNYLMPYFKVGLSSYHINSSPYQDLIDDLEDSNGNNIINVDVLPGWEYKSFGQSNSFNGKKIGYHLGFGLEVMLLKHVSLRGEYTFSNVAAKLNPYRWDDHELYGTSAEVFATSNTQTSFNIHRFKLGIVFTI